MGGDLGSESLTVAIAQTSPVILDKAANLASIDAWTTSAAARGADLIVFPECSLTGYQLESRAEADSVAEPIPGPTSTRLATIAHSLGVYIVIGMIESVQNDLHNSALLVGPDGLLGVYRKSHLPWEAVDRFVTPGNSLPVIVTPIGRLSMLICYDLRFPEPARALALSGSEIIIDIANLPEAGRPQPDFMFQTRAAENRVWLIAASRVGIERSVRFIGHSAIIDPSGKVIAEASENAEELILAEIEPYQARLKDLVFRTNEHELHLFRDRRPELYEPLGASPLDR